MDRRYSWFAHVFVSSVGQGGGLWFQFTCIFCLQSRAKKWAVISVSPQLLCVCVFFQSTAKKWTKNWAVPPDIHGSPPPTTKVKDGKNKKVKPNKTPQTSSFKAIYDGCDDEEEIRR